MNANLRTRLIAFFHRLGDMTPYEMRMVSIDVREWNYLLTELENGHRTA